MNKKIYLLLILLVSMTLSLSAQDAAFYKKYAEKGDKEAMCNLADCYLNGIGGVQQDYNMAAEWLTKAAKKNYAPAQVKLACCYITGAGVMQDYKKAWELVQKALKKNEPSAYNLVAKMYRDGIYVPKNIHRWVLYTRSAANLGSADAQSTLGAWYLYGSTEVGFPQDYTQAVQWLRKAADQGDDDGNYYLGICYDFGTGVTENKATAYKFYKIAADLGHAGAQAEVAEFLMYGEAGTEQDFSLAIDYLNKANAQENPQSAYLTGEMYYYGLGHIEQDYSYAASWYKKAADEEYTPAYPKLANMYINGLGGFAVDVKKGFELYKKAADADNEEGYMGLGLCYEYGYSVSNNMYLAVQNYKKAADLGNNYSQHRLYYAYKEGKGVTKDSNKAIQYLRQAADDDYNPALYSLGYEYLMGDLLYREVSTGLKYIEKAADNGYSFAAGVLGVTYYSGNSDVSKDYSKAFKYLSQAVHEPSKMNDGLAAEVYRDLGACYRFGRGTEIDHSLASYYTEQAAKYGDESSFDAVKALRN